EHTMVLLQEKREGIDWRALKLLSNEKWSTPAGVFVPYLSMKQPPETRAIAASALVRCAPNASSVMLRALLEELDSTRTEMEDALQSALKRFEWLAPQALDREAALRDRNRRIGPPIID